MKCSKCGAELNEGVRFCENCGAAVSATKTKDKKKRRKIIWITIGVILLLGFISSMGNDSDDDNTTSHQASVNKDGTDNEKKAVLEVVGLAYDEAYEKLSQAGFTNITSNAVLSDNDNEWVVVGQSVKAGEKIIVTEAIVLDCEKKCQLYLEISSENNILFNKYEIVISLDGEEIGAVANGTTWTTMVDVLSGDHEIVFSKKDENSLKTSKKVSFADSCTYSCILAHDGDDIEVSEESQMTGVEKATLNVLDVTGMVLSEAENELLKAGFVNVSHKSEKGSIWDSDNWIVVSQNIEAGTIADAGEDIQLQCISLDDYFENEFVGKNVKEIEQFAAEKGFEVMFQDEKMNNLENEVASMSEEEKVEWEAAQARQYTVKDKTACVTIYNAKKAAEDAAFMETVLALTRKEDIDEDLLITKCERDADVTAMYIIEFARCDEDGDVVRTFSFDSRINPYAMGDEFSAMGDLPSWFKVGKYVHVKAKAAKDGCLSQSDCIVTEPTGEMYYKNEASDDSNVDKIEMPVMSGTSLENALTKAAEYGVTKRVDDEDFGHGTRQRSMSNNAGSLTIDIIYVKETNEIICASIVTFKTATASEQDEFIKGMAGVLCPKNDVDEVSKWVKSNVHTKNVTTISEFEYETGVGPADNALYYAGNANWEKWDAQY